MQLDDHLYAVILAGGSGTRFWPLSRELYPKQMLSLLGPHSLFQETLLRLHGAIPATRTLIVTNVRQSFDLRSQAASIDSGYRFLEEPESKNTAPAIGLAAHALQLKDPEAIMAVMPSDHWVKDRSRFLQLLQDALEPARRGLLVTFGIRPTRPETGFGYVQVEQAAPRGPDRSPAGSPSDRLLPVRRFVEKPDGETARRFLEEGAYYWNSGIFVWKAEVILQEIERYLPQLSRLLAEVRASLGTAAEAAQLTRAYRQMEAISIDYGVMERKADSVVLLEADVGWHDLGSWSALDEVCERDPAGNIASGNLYDLGSRNSILLAGTRLLATVGLEGMVVVDTEDATLVCPKEHSQRVREIAEGLKRQGREEQAIHRTVHRPWGQYTVLEKGEGYKIKRIVVDPGARLSLQLHRRRSEHWVVLSGVARVTIAGRSFELQPHQSSFVPIGTPHRLENPGTIPLQIIEAQIGDYVEEDDIERMDDQYGREVVWPPETPPPLSA
jgi:mannose-1-phosphate guanylyltransferase/mannose-6-phosphate isomerase